VQKSPARGHAARTGMGRPCCFGLDRLIVVANFKCLTAYDTAKQEAVSMARDLLTVLKLFDAGTN